MPDENHDETRAQVLRGASALYEAFSLMGIPDKTDHDFVKPIVENELDVRALIEHALAAL